MKKVFNLFFKDHFQKNSKILGLKLLIAGRLKGKLRKKKIFIQAKTDKNQITSIAGQTISKDIEFTKLDVFSRYGVFGFKLWTYYK
jgi:hypothetical protein